jgi:hypothetical protein
MSKAIPDGNAMDVEHFSTQTQFREMLSCETPSPRLPAAIAPHDSWTMSMRGFWSFAVEYPPQ